MCTKESALNNGIMTLRYHIMSSFQGSLWVYRALTLRTRQPWGWMLHCTDTDESSMVQTLWRYPGVGGTAAETSCLGTGVGGGIRHLIIALSSVSQSIVCHFQL